MTPSGSSTPARIGLFTIAALAGGAIAAAWSDAIADVLYRGILGAFVDPQIALASLGLAIAFGFLVGATHFVHL